MRTFLPALPSLLLGSTLLLATSATLAAPAYVNALGVEGWQSGDTRNVTGAQASAGEIATQIQFVDGPAGATNGAVRLFGTTANAGKSDIGHLDAGGIADASSLLSTDFTLSYRAYSEPLATPRTVGLGLSVFNGTNYYTFSHTDPGTNANQNQWREDTVNASTGLFRLYGSSGVLDGGAERTLADWAAQAAWDDLFSDTYDVVRINFNIGSFQRNAAVYVDWLETNLLNGGDRVDFVSADFTAAVPEPGSLALLGAALTGLAWVRRRQTR